MTTYIEQLNNALQSQVKGGKTWRLQLPLPSSAQEQAELDAWLAVLREETGAEIQVDLKTEGDA